MSLRDLREMIKAIIAQWRKPKPAPAPQPPHGGGTGGSLTPGAGDVAGFLSLLNEYRLHRGKPSLVLNTKLTLAAQRHSDRMAQAQELSHQLPGEPDLRGRLNATGYAFSWGAENSAYLDKPSPAQALKVWQNSPPHDKNMLDDKARDAGIASNGRYWTLNLGAGR